MKSRPPLVARVLSLLLFFLFLFFFAETIRVVVLVKRMPGNARNFARVLERKSLQLERD